MGAAHAKHGTYNSQELETVDEKKYGSTLECNTPAPRKSRRRISLKKVTRKIKFKNQKKQNRKSSTAVLQEEFDKVNRIFYDLESNKAKNMIPLSLDNIQNIINENSKEEQVDKSTKRNSCICFTNNKTVDTDSLVSKPFYASMPNRDAFKCSAKLLTEWNSTISNKLQRKKIIQLFFKNRSQFGNLLWSGTRLEG